MQTKTKRKTRSILFKLALLLLLAVVVFQLVNLQMQISKKSDELQTLQQQVEQQEQENEQLQSQLDNGITDEYIEKIAREKLGYVSPFERIYVDITQE